jgi:AraC-like DNA-binding protein
MVLHAVSIADSTPGRLSRSGRAVSRFRHDDAHPVRWFGLGFRGTTLQPPGPPGWHRLIAARSGACLARAAGLVATISTDHGMLVADGVPVQLHASERIDVRMLYLDVSRMRTDITPSRAVAITPLLRELTERNVERGALDARNIADSHLIDVIFDEAHALAGVPFALAFPSDPRALRAAEHCLAAGDATIDRRRLAEIAGTSARTLERLFVRQTGCSVGRWQRRMRLLAAARSLAAGGSLNDSAFNAGYASPSAFISAFRRTFGITPGRLSRGIGEARSAGNAIL